MDKLWHFTETLQQRFFSEWFWLPPGMTWKQFENRPEDPIYIAQPRDLFYCIPFAIGLYLIRNLFENYLAYPFGLYMNVSTKTVKSVPNSSLEVFYNRMPYPTDQLVKAIAKQTDLSERYIQRWFRRRRNQDRPSVMVKFTETAWRLFFYVFIFIYGVVVLWDKPWFANTRMCWLDNFPRQNVSTEIFCYYMIELGFYLGLIFSQFRDVKRKDFWEQFLHHIATILLMCFSWMCNLTRIGTLVLCLHDIVDWLLEGAKLARYMNKTTICDVMFGSFTIMWVITRLMMYPYYILYTTSVDATDLVGPARSIFLFNGLLWILQVLHVIWFIIIFKVAYKAVVKGQVEKDIRSASEESSDDNKETNHNKLKNGELNGYSQG